MLKGRWADGIAPRNFAWIVQGRLTVSERPGGYAPHHRKVRRQEEILWLEAQGFTRVVSLLSSSHNLHAYEELGLPASHFGLPPHSDVRDVLMELYPAMLAWIYAGERLLVHQDELSERVAGVAAGFLCWCGVLPDPPRAIYAVEQLVRRQLGSDGRAIVALAALLPPPGGGASAPESTQSEPCDVQPPQSEPPQSEPPQSEPPQSEPPQSEPHQSEPHQSEPTPTRSVRARSGPTRRALALVEDVPAPGETVPGERGPAGAGPASGGHGSAEPDSHPPSEKAHASRVPTPARQAPRRRATGEPQHPAGGPKPPS